MLNYYFYTNISKHANNKTKRSYYKHFRNNNNNDDDDINNNNNNNNIKNNNNNDKKKKKKKVHINPCEKAICLNGGSCVWTIGEDYVYQCYCASGYYGANCEYSAAECMTHPCQHDGRCVRSKSVFGFKCICTDGYYGSRCQKKRRKSVYNQREEEEEARMLNRRRAKLENSGKYSATLAYVNVEFVAILVAMFILFLLFLVILERDRYILVERYKTLVMANYQDVMLPKISFGKICFRRLKCLTFNLCLYIPGCSSLMMTDDDYLLLYPFPSPSLIELGSKYRVKRNQQTSSAITKIK